MLMCIQRRQEKRGQSFTLKISLREVESSVILLFMAHYLNHRGATELKFFGFASQCLDGASSIATITASTSWFN
jgi:hypothetical protein